MRLIGKPLELTMNLIKSMKDDPAASVSIEVAMSLIYTIEALQQENEQLRAQIEAFGIGYVDGKRTAENLDKETYERLHQQIYEATELWTQGKDYHNPVDADEIEQLRAQVARMREALEHFKKKYIDDLCLEYPPEDAEMIINALSANTTDYHNPADVEALRKAREALENAQTAYLNEREMYVDEYEAVVKVLAEIDKAIGGGQCV